MQGLCASKSQPQFAESLASYHGAFSAASLVLAAGLPVKQSINKEFFLSIYSPGIEFLMAFPTREREGEIQSILDRNQKDASLI